MRKLGPHVVVSLTGAIAFAAACSSDPPEDFVPPGGASSSSGSTVPGGGGSSSGGTSSSGGSSGGATSTTDGGKEGAAAGDCSKMGKVHEDAACDACTKSKCCTQLQACDASPSCKAMQTCLSACKSDDFGCAFDCYAQNSKGGEVLQEVGTCAAQQCKNECPSSGFEFDGGFPF